jgi:hypothetical protein
MATARVDTDRPIDPAAANLWEVFRAIEQLPLKGSMPGMQSLRQILHHDPGSEGGKDTKLPHRVMNALPVLGIRGNLDVGRRRFLQEEVFLECFNTGFPQTVTDAPHFADGLPAPWPKQRRIFSHHFVLDRQAVFYMVNARWKPCSRRLVRPRRELFWYELDDRPSFSETVVIEDVSGSGLKSIFEDRRRLEATLQRIYETLQANEAARHADSMRRMQTVAGCMGRLGII